MQAPTIVPDEVGELFLQNNLLRNPTQLDLSNSAKLKLLNLEKNFFTEINFYLPNNLNTLMLAGNNLTSFKTYFPANITTWTLSDNPWICDCNAIPLWELITSYEKAVSY